MGNTETNYSSPFGSHPLEDHRTKQLGEEKLDKALVLKAPGTEVRVEILPVSFKNQIPVSGA